LWLRVVEEEGLEIPGSVLEAAAVLVGLEQEHPLV
jgi:hypothetical protein